MSLIIQLPIKLENNDYIIEVYYIWINSHFRVYTEFSLEVKYVQNMCVVLKVNIFFTKACCLTELSNPSPNLSIWL